MSKYCNPASYNMMKAKGPGKPLVPPTPKKEEKETGPMIRPPVTPPTQPESSPVDEQVMGAEVIRDEDGDITLEEKDTITVEHKVTKEDVEANKEVVSENGEPLLKEGEVVELPKETVDGDKIVETENGISVEQKVETPAVTEDLKKPTDVQNMECPTCKKVCKNETGLIAHMRLAHK